MNTADARGPRERGASGQVLIMFTFVLIILLMGVGVGVDLAGYYARKTQSEHAVEAARDAVVSQVGVIKFADSPGTEIFETIAKALEDNGYEGTATMSFYEAEREYVAPSGKKVGKSHRIEGVYLELEGTYKTNLISIVGIGSITARSQGAWSLDLYSKSDAVWGPNSQGAGFGRTRTYSVAQGKASLVTDSTIASLGSSTVPQSLRDAINQAAESVAR